MKRREMYLVVLVLCLVNVVGALADLDFGRAAGWTVASIGYGGLVARES